MESVLEFSTELNNMKYEDQKKTDFDLPKVISLNSEDIEESKKLTAEEQLQKSLSDGTLRTSIRLAPESRIIKDNPEIQAEE